MFENRKECSKTGNDVLKQERTFKTGKGHSKTGKDVLELVLLFKKVCKSAIAHRTPKNKAHARTSHTQFQKPFRTHFRPHIACAEVRYYAHVRRNPTSVQIEALKSNVHFRKITGTKSLPNVSKLSLEKNYFKIGNPACISLYSFKNKPFIFNFFVNQVPWILGTFWRKRKS